MHRGGKKAGSDQSVDRCVLPLRDFLPVSQNFGALLMQCDLFPPDLLPPKNKGGRPMFKKTQENQLVVDGMVRQGASVTQIADVLGITAPTVRRHFSRLNSWQVRWGYRSRSERAEAQDA